MAEVALQALSSWQSTTSTSHITLLPLSANVEHNNSGPGSFVAKATFQLPDGGRFCLLLSGTKSDSTLMPMVENDLGLPDGFLIDINTYLLAELTAENTSLSAHKLVSATLTHANKLYEKQRFIAPKEPVLATSKQSSPESVRPAVNGGQKRKRAAIEGYTPPQFGSSRLATATIMKQIQLLKAMDTRKDGFTAQPIEDNLYEWNVCLYFDDVDSPIAEDLHALPGHDAITLELRFPADYPSSPPIVRIVSPFVSGGHVTRNGGICMELLTTSGWAPVNSIDVVCIQIRAMLIQGGARIHPTYQNRVANYTLEGALKDLKLIVMTHQWNVPHSRPRKLPS